MADGAKKQSPVRLSNSNLAALPDGIPVPLYDRKRLSAGIVHIGLGNFHRAHQAWYLHRLMQQGLALDWAIIGAGVRHNDAAMRDKLLAQDCLTTLIELDPSGTSAEVTGPMIDFLPIEEANGALIAAMASPEIRIVALTVTEGGYFVDPATGGFDQANPDIQHDAANPQTPRTAFGAIIAALKIRQETGIGAFTVQSCDNLQGNGAVVRQTIISLARLSDPDLAKWIEMQCSFPNSMVDCIVPATGPDEIQLVQSLGIDDHAPVTHENYRQWVIEDNFCAGRPDWDKAGATFSDAVHDYEAMKIRVLNAGHQVVANAGELLSIETISDCMSDPEIRGLFRKVQADEITPYISAVPSMEPGAYADLIERRFSNPAILDTTRRVAFDGSSRHTGFVLPILRDALAANGKIAGLALVEALWARMCTGVREDGSLIAPNDPHWDSLHSVAKQAQERPLAWLEQSQFYGDLANSKPFADAFEGWLTEISSDGVRATLSRFASDTK